ncbi:glucose-6-phosphate exchanger SLC37A4-like [Acanthaster planci]|uniref:Glucose-6-phosphate exchanger SLC37A4-like n=1 Tax=Acanthaster planci TaxID=133434 RepID=A0A8B7Y3K9_ACAPL|nr:glucose-6-phosphate exchanger SLC37A4-like [Acanthaster planci]XP_022086901.1 glucose-6-phosphate exchanger SLC37A4-like [Acanthaster planci]XP_022086903.1 glucose-6-phosphate exchanger SLC37A4-like [Acanthaster planci]XP_022086904.1 glucose-6-phosphate exchanger SLC37A4-like [Acanthaster planci]XP_022086905.1 glucose-6-phosphate exchanger SLC37A4-like [Acanthaster planci]
MESYTLRRAFIYATLFVGYFLYYLNRKSFSFLMPYVIEEDRMHRSDLGAITSSISLAYTISKFVSGVLSDKVSARVLFSSGLFLASLLVLQFTGFQSLQMLMVLWFLNGIAQGGGWPACSKILKQWFLPSELGLWWSVLSTSANLAGVVGPVCLSVVAKDYGWRTAMYIGGVLGIAMAGASLLLIKNSPSEAGLEPRTAAEATNAPASSKNASSDASPSQSSATTRDVIGSPFLWVVSVLFFLTALIAYGVMDWGQLYLIQEVGFENAVGSAFTSSYSIGAIVGSVLAGFVTDRLVARASKNCKTCPRFPWFMFMEGINLMSIHIFRSLVTIDTNEVFILAIGFLFGLAQYGAFSVYGVVAIENAPVHLSGTSHAFAAMACNVGVLMAGYPLTYIAERFDWSVVLMCLEAMSLTSLLLLVAARKVEARIGKPPLKVE